MNNNEIKTFIIKTSVISSLVILVLSSHVKDFINCMVSVVLNPFFSVDLNNDGEPDLEELKRMIIQIGKYKFQFGKLLFSLIEITIKVLLLLSFLYIIMKYTDLINIKYTGK